MFDTHPSARSVVTGFTLVELLVTVSIVAILLGLAAPSFQSFILDSRLTAEAQKFMLAIQTARSEASRINATTLLCASADNSNCGTDWAGNKLVFADVNKNWVRDSAEPPVFLGEPSPASITVAGPPSGRLQFYSSGQALAVGEFTFCDTRAGPFGRQITVEANGRPSMTPNVQCPPPP